MATKSKKAEAKDAHLSEATKERVSVAVRKLIGKGRAVEGIVRSSLSPKYGMYIWYGLDNGKVVGVTINEGGEVKVEFKADDSWAVREWKKVQFKRARREEKLAAKRA